MGFPPARLAGTVALGSAQSRSDRSQKLLDGEWLCDPTGNAERLIGAGINVLYAPRNQNCRQRHPRDARLSDKFQTCHARHVVVRDEQLEELGPQKPPAILPVRAGCDIVTGAGQGSDGHPPEVEVVVHHQDFLRLDAAGSGVRGAWHGWLPGRDIGSVRLGGLGAFG